jgi:hypothetical protein
MRNQQAEETMNKRAIRIALEDIAWELSIEANPRIIAELEEERDDLARKLLQ